MSSEDFTNKTDGQNNNRLDAYLLEESLPEISGIYL